MTPLETFRAALVVLGSVKRSLQWAVAYHGPMVVQRWSIEIAAEMQR